MSREVNDPWILYPHGMSLTLDDDSLRTWRFPFYGLVDGCEGVWKLAVNRWSRLGRYANSGWAKQVVFHIRWFSQSPVLA
jgi:hypothetical protein